MAQLTKNYDVTIETHHLTDRSTDKLGKLAYVTLSEEFIIYSNDYLVPFHALDTAVVVTSVDRPPRIYGADNVSITEGSRISARPYGRYVPRMQRPRNKGRFKHHLYERCHGYELAVLSMHRPSERETACRPRHKELYGSSVSVR